jgi:CRP-like cAMP-binding protein
VGELELLGEGLRAYAHTVTAQADHTILLSLTVPQYDRHLRETRLAHVRGMMRVLSALPLFADVGEERMLVLACLTRELPCAAGALLQEEGREASHVFLLKDGCAELTAGGESRGHVGGNILLGLSDLHTVLVSHESHQEAVGALLTSLPVTALGFGFTSPCLVSARLRTACSCLALPKAAVLAAASEGAQWRGFRAQAHFLWGGDPSRGEEE